MDAAQPLRNLLEHAAGHRGRVRLVYGSVPYVITVVSVTAELVTGASEDRGLLRFRLERITHAEALPSNRPLF